MTRRHGTARHRTARPVTAGVALALALAVGACGDDAEPQSAPTTVTPVTTTATDEVSVVSAATVTVATVDADGTSETLAADATEDPKDLAEDTPTATVTVTAIPAGEGPTGGPGRTGGLLIAGLGVALLAAAGAGALRHVVRRPRP